MVTQSLLKHPFISRRDQAKIKTSHSLSFSLLQSESDVICSAFNPSCPFFRLNQPPGSNRAQPARNASELFCPTPYGLARANCMQRIFPHAFSASFCNKADCNSRSFSNGRLAKHSKPLKRSQPRVTTLFKSWKTSKGCKCRKHRAYLLGSGRNPRASRTPVSAQLVNSHEPSTILTGDKQEPCQPGGSSPSYWG